MAFFTARPISKLLKRSLFSLFERLFKGGEKTGEKTGEKSSEKSGQKSKRRRAESHKVGLLAKIMVSYILLLSR